MAKIVFSASFLKLAASLPKTIQAKLAKFLTVLQTNPFNPKLHTKYLSGPLVGFLSFRVTRDWRVIFRFLEPDIIQLVEVAHRKDIYRK